MKDLPVLLPGGDLQEWSALGKCQSMFALEQESRTSWCVGSSKMAQDMGQGYHMNKRAVLVLWGSVNSRVPLQTLVYIDCG